MYTCIYMCTSLYDKLHQVIIIIIYMQIHNISKHMHNLNIMIAYKLFDSQI